MFDKLRKEFGGKGAKPDAEPIPTAVATTPPYSPYADSGASHIYNLMFCDVPDGFAPRSDRTPAPWQTLLYRSPNPARVAELAADASAESRVRALAFNWLRTHGEAVPKGIVLGAIFEVPLDGGPDALAAYDDGAVRYTNQSGKMGFIEPGGLPEANQRAKDLVELCRGVVAKIGPWDKPRLPPPRKPAVRMTFLVSDGLYFGQGPFEVMERDPMAGPLLTRAAELLKVVTDAAIAREDSQRA